MKAEVGAACGTGRVRRPRLQAHLRPLSPRVLRDGVRPRGRPVPIEQSAATNLINKWCTPSLKRTSGSSPATKR
ncbi:hypothetical protein NDU88_001846 [Pleurodeles waltl]|uniref:Uncharacterized protein n=1 Tax=Pleurodeles waltl TaxID=8319 RepID=A0AAV7LE19_PLEWA|nr:hypothetical protein NDU88_001846 [Pleurodeles waltl]